MNTQYIVHQPSIHTTCYYDDNKHKTLHREDGPAYIKENEQRWYIDGNLHREDGPAVIKLIGKSSEVTCNEWYKHNVRHREDGPAVEWSDGDKFWWINGEELSEKDFNQLYCKQPIHQV
jgi:hypothetical protein